MKCYPEIKEKEEMRKIIGRYGLTGKQQVSRGGCGGTAPDNWEIVATRPGCTALETQVWELSQKSLFFFFFFFFLK